MRTMMSRRESTFFASVDFPEAPLENPDGWGPCEAYDHLKYLPLEQFAKNDKVIGASETLYIADWYKHPSMRGKNGRYNNRYRKGDRNDKNKKGRGSKYSKTKPVPKVVTDDPKTWEFITHQEHKQKQRFGRKAIQKARLRRKHQRDTQTFRKDVNAVATGERTFGGHARARRSRYKKRQNLKWKANQRNREENSYKFEPSLQANANWQQKDNELWLPDMTQLKYDLNTDSFSETILKDLGRGRLMRKNLNRISLSRPVKLKATKEFIQNKTATKDDPIFQSYVEEGDVFITSELMAVIMCMPHSVKSFDFIVTKDHNDKLWIDLRDESDLYEPQPFEAVHKRIVKEPATENYLKAISKEALTLKLRFKDFVLDKKRDPITGPDGTSPFPKKGMSSTALRYKKFELLNYSVICRCRFDAYDDNREPVMIFTSSQHNPRETKNAVNWSEEIERKFGAVKTTDVNNNFFRYKRWAVEAMLVKAKKVSLGFLNRVHPEDSKNHQILKCVDLTIRDFAKGYSRTKNFENAWGVFDNLIEKFRAEDFEEGKYVVLRDAMRDKIHIFKVDDNEFDEVEEDVYGSFGTGSSRI